MFTHSHQSPTSTTHRTVIGAGLIGVWGLASLLGHLVTQEVELAFRFRDLARAFDGPVAEWTFRLFPGAVFPSYFAGVDLHGAIGTDVTFILHDPVALGLGIADGLTVLLVVIAAVMLIRPRRPWTQVLVGLTALHVLAHLSFVVFTATVPISFALGSVIPVAGLVVMLLGRGDAAQAPSAVAMADPTARVFAVQTPTGWSDWVTHEQLVWLGRTGDVTPSSVIFDGRNQTTQLASDIPGLF